jgi:hypothetical protein
MSTYVNTQLPKLCHATVGQQVRLPDTQTGEVQKEVFIVAAREQRGQRGSRAGMSHGLYDDERELMLVSLSTGLARRMPHLSSRAQLLRAEDLPTLPVADAPVLVRKPGPAWCQLEVNSSGLKLSESVDLADETEVLALLHRLQKRKGTILSVTETETHPDEAKRLAEWRRDVADGATLLSFDDYKEAHA